MSAAAEKPMDGDILSVFLILWMEATICYSYYYLFFKACNIPCAWLEADKTFEELFFNVFAKFFAMHLSEGYTYTYNVEDGGAAQTYVARASPGKSN
jgi:hypothetical protein